MWIKLKSGLSAHSNPLYFSRSGIISLEIPQNPRLKNFVLNFFQRITHFLKNSLHKLQNIFSLKSEFLFFLAQDGISL